MKRKKHRHSKPITAHDSKSVHQTISRNNPPAALNERNGLFCLILFIAVIAAYLPVWHAGFIWDDDRYVTNNPLLSTPGGLKDIWFSAHHQSQYFPLAFTTLRFEYGLWGLNPLGYHIVNVLIHALNALLVWRILRQLGVKGAGLAAATFALHPVQVESVAWISELKNVQSTFFYLLAVLAWVRSIRFPALATRYYGFTLLCGALAMLSKTTACTLPAALFLTLWILGQRLSWRRMWQIAPFVLMGLAMGLISIWWEQHLGDYTKEVGQSLTLVQRVAVANHAIWFYPGKLLWPNLCFSYPLWNVEPHNYSQYIWIAATVTVAGILWWKRRALGNKTIAAVLFFVAALSPLLGFIPLYTFIYTFVADHYQYAASIGIIALFAGGSYWAADRWSERIGIRPEHLKKALFILPLVLGILTWRQSQIYRDGETLWRNTLEKNPSSWLAHDSLGVLLAGQGKFAEAESEFHEALSLKPEHEEGLSNLGTLMIQQGHLEEGIALLRRAIAANANDAAAQSNLGKSLAREGQYAEAVEHFKTAIQLQPLQAAFYNDLGNTLVLLGQKDEALQQFQLALARDPGLADAHNNLADIFIQQGRLNEAVEQYLLTVKREPNRAVAQNNLGNALLQQKQPDQAVIHFAKAVEVQPNNEVFHCNLGIALAQCRRFADAAQQFQAAIQLRPNYSDAALNLTRLAWILATSPTPSIRDGKLAIQLAEQVQALSNTDLLNSMALAAAYAEAGRFSDAISLAHKTIQLAEEQKNSAIENAVEAQLKFYEAGSPFRDTPASR